MCHDQEHNPLTIAAALAYILHKPLNNDIKSNDYQESEPHKRRTKKHFDSDATSTEEGMVRCKIDMGHSHHIQPRQIVGLIANKADVSSKYIGEIKIFDDYTIIDLDEQIAATVLKKLGKIKLRSGIFHLKLMQ